MAANTKARNRAKEYIDGAIELQRRLGYPVNVPKKIYDAVMKDATSYFEELIALKEQRDKAA